MAFDYEKSVKRLEEIAVLLEDGTTGLEKSVELFAEGSALVKECSAFLDKAQQRIKELTADTDGDGNL